MPHLTIKPEDTRLLITPNNLNTLRVGTVIWVDETTRDTWIAQADKIGPLERSMFVRQAIVTVVGANDFGFRFIGSEIPWVASWLSVAISESKPITPPPPEPDLPPSD